MQSNSRVKIGFNPKQKRERNSQRRAITVAAAGPGGGSTARSSRMVSTRVRRRSQNRRSSEAGLASATVAESMGREVCAAEGERATATFDLEGRRGRKVVGSGGEPFNRGWAGSFATVGSERKGWNRGEKWLVRRAQAGERVRGRFVFIAVCYVLNASKIIND